MGGHVRALLDKAGYTTIPVDAFSQGDEALKSINDVTVSADVIIDFSFHTLTEEVVDYAASKNIPAVICTTGHTPEEKERISKAAEKTAIFYSGNMSIGIATLCDAVKRVVSVFPDADVEICETHHNRKLDAPSGTALMLFDAVKEVRPDAVAVNGRAGQSKREKNDVGISALRMGNIVGIHEVAICTDNERITLKHEAFDRALFADGAIKAAEYLVDKPAGFYNMKTMMK
jgi:4-hydroxy-tetrahydrodipicolinate reductase